MGWATYAVFEPHMQAPVVARLEQETGLRRAMERDELTLHYQPLIDLATGALVGLEALVRWDHPKYGMLPTADFIQLAEETALIIPLGLWALRQACHQARMWEGHAAVTPPLVMSVNLSARQFRQPSLVAEVVRVLEETGLDPRRLELEITESVVTKNSSETIRTLRALRELGVYLAIDDFGTGYSSLSYLRELAVDTLKIDRTFVAGLDREAGSLAIVRAVTTLAHDLGMTVTAEGIETAEQWASLRDLGVDRGQGYYFARPRPGEAIGDLLAGAVTSFTPPPARSPNGRSGLRAMEPSPTATPVL